MSATASPAARPPLSISLAYGSVPSRREIVRLGVPARALAHAASGATCAPSSHCAIVGADVAFDRLELALLAGSTNVIARPERPTRPVRPMRWT